MEKEKNMLKMSPEVQTRDANLRFLDWWRHDQGYNEVEACINMYRDLRERVNMEESKKHYQIEFLQAQVKDAAALLQMALRDEARTIMKPYPQYDGKFDRWILGEITRKVDTKGGLQAEVNDIVLVSPENEPYIPGDTSTGYRTFRSRRTNSHVRIEEEYISII